MFLENLFKGICEWMVGVVNPLMSKIVSRCQRNISLQGVNGLKSTLYFFQVS